MPFYVVDATCFVLLGLVLIAWSRRRFGGAAPGLIGYLAFMRFYLSQPFQTTGERDWHVAFLVCSALMLSQTWPGRRSRIASAIASAMALLIRPHAVLFLPALAASIAEPARGPATSPLPRAAGRPGVGRVAGHLPGPGIRPGDRVGNCR